MDIKKTILTITTIGLTGISANYFVDEAQINSFKADFEMVGGSQEMSRDISEYFQGSKDYMTWTEMNEWVRVANTIEIKNFEKIESKKDFVKKMNFAITEKAKIERDIKGIEKPTDLQSGFIDPMVAISLAIVGVLVVLIPILKWKILYVVLALIIGIIIYKKLNNK